MRANEKTNAMRLLDGRKVQYEGFTYSPEIHVATEVADILGVPHDSLYKTLVVLREKGKPLLVMVPGNREIGLRRLAKSVHEKSLRMASQKEAEKLTGLQVGGISALALLNHGFEICLDRPALALERIFISGGRRGASVRLAVADLVKLTSARVVDATPEMAPADAAEA